MGLFLTGLATFGGASSAWADTILTYAQTTPTNSKGQPIGPFVSVHSSGSTTTVSIANGVGLGPGGSGNEMAITVGQIADPSLIVPFTAYLSLSLTSAGPLTAFTLSPGVLYYSQPFSGSFEVDSKLGGPAAAGNVDLLSSTNLSGTITYQTGTQPQLLFNINPTTTLVSDVISPTLLLKNETGTSLSFTTTTTPGFHGVSGVNATYNSATSLSNTGLITSGITTNQVPEPSTFALLGLGALGLVAGKLRRRSSLTA